ncbi:type IV pilin [Haloarchaeobius sp. DFWS5]|uniref:type IV pilin n=1 Tax=Haloarchaeobius sp. DFWS5 TaxID=3446114 RepID=UPI003EB9B671
MELKNLFTEDDAVSPVIGVILMVAITVILAAVIGAFVLNIGGNQESAPQAQLDFAYPGGNNVEITHGGGDTLNTDQLSATGALSGNCDLDQGSVSAGGFLNTSACTHGGASSGTTVSVTWTASSGDSSQIIAESQVP